MKKLYIEISSCRSCPFSKAVLYYGILCKHPRMKFKNPLVRSVEDYQKANPKDGHNIPEWCPLPTISAMKFDKGFFK